MSFASYGTVDTGGRAIASRSADSWELLPNIEEAQEKSFFSKRPRIKFLIVLVGVAFVVVFAALSINDNGIILSSFFSTFPSIPNGDSNSDLSPIDPTTPTILTTPSVSIITSPTIAIPTMPIGVLPTSDTTPSLSVPTDISPLSIPTDTIIVPTLSPTSATVPSLPTVETTPTIETPTSTDDALTFTLSRDGYDPLIYFTRLDASIFQYKILEGYVAVVEPSSDMNLELFSSSSDAYYYFTICSVDTPTDCVASYKYSNGEATSSPINIACTPFSDFLVTVLEYSTSSNTLLRTSDGLAKCIYVRREIRTLTDSDLSNTMDAMFSMWTTAELEGQKIYGNKFHSSTFLLEFHFFNAAWQEGDHIHEGNGFLPQHIKMTNIFEESIQSVDPSITVPYWDFTIESTQNISVMLSPVFTAEMFGSMPRSVDQYWGWTYRNDSLQAAAIQDGRWAFIKADKNDRYDDLKYGYGYLRAPWNLNPSPYLSRFTSTNKHLPSCVSHYSLLEYDDLKDFLFESPYAAHAATHGTIGGVYGCDMMDEMMEKGYLVDDEGQINLCKNWIFYLKEFFRLNYLVPFSNCTYDENVPATELQCGYTCNDDLTSDFVFELKNILNSDNDCIPYDLQDAGWFAWKDFICTGNGYKVFGGDHLEAASPADPSFWPIHPTLDRLLHAKYMAGGFIDDDWPSDAKEEYVCDKGSCYNSTLDAFDYYDYCCYGHYEYDQLMDAATNNKFAGYGQTNREVHTASDPTSLNYSMPYIYADFDWSHCNLVGLDFTALLEEMAEKIENMDDTPVDLDVPTAKPTQMPSSATFGQMPTQNPAGIISVITKAQVSKPGDNIHLGLVDGGSGGEDSASTEESSTFVATDMGRRAQENEVEKAHRGLGVTERRKLRKVSKRRGK